MGDVILLDKGGGNNLHDWGSIEKKNSKSVMLVSLITKSF